MIKILFFGALRERLQCANLSFELNSPCTVADVMAQLRQRSPLFADALLDANLLYALNQQLCDVQTQVHSGDEVAFFPPVTGG